MEDDRRGRGGGRERWSSRRSRSRSRGSNIKGCSKGMREKRRHGEAVGGRETGAIEEEEEKE